MALREDLGKADRKAQLEAATRALLEYGEPPGDDDELMSAMGGLGLGGGGSLHSASMSHGASWEPASVTASIYRSMFPTAGERARVLFANWVPPQRAASPPRPEAPASMDASLFGLSGGGPGGGAGLGAGVPYNGGDDDDGPADMSSFLGGGSGSGSGKAAPSTGTGKAGKGKSGGAYAPPDSGPDDDGPMNSSFSSFGAPSKPKGARRKRGAADEDDEDDTLGPRGRRR